MRGSHEIDTIVNEHQQGGFRALSLDRFQRIIIGGVLILPGNGCEAIGFDVDLRKFRATDPFA